MIYFRVLPKFDQTPVRKGNEYKGFLIGGELYTEKELIKKGMLQYTAYMEKVEISKNSTYFLFGARFKSCKNIPHEKA